MTTMSYPNPSPSSLSSLYLSLSFCRLSLPPSSSLSLTPSPPSPPIPPPLIIPPLPLGHTCWCHMSGCNNTSICSISQAIVSLKSNNSIINYCKTNIQLKESTWKTISSYSLSARLPFWLGDIDYCNVGYFIMAANKRKSSDENFFTYGVDR